MARSINESQKLPTLIDVAKHANVSKQTISRVINNKDEVAPATRQRVLNAIAELGYQPNSLARSLVTNKTMVVGLSVPNIDQPFFPQIVGGVEESANKQGYNVFLCNVDGDPHREMNAIKRMRGHRVAGVISFGSHMTDEMVEEISGGHLPLVLVNREVPATGGRDIWPGYEAGSYLATHHLIDQGRRAIVFLGLERESNVDADKLRGYKRALADADIPFEPGLIFQSEQLGGRNFHDLLARGHEVTESIVNSDLKFDAVFASNDLPAIGVTRQLAARGVRVPDDVAVIGFGGAEVSSIVSPPLSTVAIPLRRMGSSAFLALLAEINGQPADQRADLTEPELIIRESTAGVAKLS